jgi:8-oxo-dGTP diphosphatase
VEHTAHRAEVVAGIVVRDGHVLLCHRRADRTWYPAVWDFPGGHVETGETPTGALVRELREELEIVIEEPADPEHFRLVSEEFDMKLWVVTRWDGSPRNVSPAEHDDLAWMSAQAARGVTLADESYPSVIAQVLGEAGPGPGDG